MLHNGSGPSSPSPLSKYERRQELPAVACGPTSAHHIEGTYDLDRQTRADALHVATVHVQGAVQLTAVQIGRDFGSAVESLRGVESGEHLIINPADSLLADAAVRVSGAAP
jgi:hypothetical protein